MRRAEAESPLCESITGKAFCAVCRGGGEAGRGSPGICSVGKRSRPPIGHRGVSRSQAGRARNRLPPDIRMGNTRAAQRRRPSAADGNFPAASAPRSPLSPGAAGSSGHFIYRAKKSSMAAVTRGGSTMNETAWAAPSMTSSSLRPVLALKSCRPMAVGTKVSSAP